MTPHIMRQKQSQLSRFFEPYRRKINCEIHLTDHQHVISITENLIYLLHFRKDLFKVIIKNT